jgi:hypothetical protein
LKSIEIIFESPITATPYDSYEELPVIPEAVRAKLDGQTENDELAQYIVDDTELRECLAGSNLKKGTMSLRHANGILTLVTTFSADRELTPPQLSALTSFVSGQYSDGGGAGWLQQFNDDFELRFEADYQNIRAYTVTS